MDRPIIFFPKVPLHGDISPATQYKIQITKVPTEMSNLALRDAAATSGGASESTNGLTPYSEWDTRYSPNWMGSVSIMYAMIRLKLLAGR